MTAIIDLNTISKIIRYQYIEGLGNIRIIDPGFDILVDELSDDELSTNATTKVISTRQTTFRSDNEKVKFDIDRPHWLTTIIVELKEYEDGKQYFYIDYKPNFIKSSKYSKEAHDNLKIKAHPFFNLLNIDQDYDGDIVYNNELTEQMIKYLLLEDDSSNDDSSKDNSDILSVFCDEITKIINKYLLLDNEALSKISGMTTPEDYRNLITMALTQINEFKLSKSVKYKKLIISLLAMFWD